MTDQTKLPNLSGVFAKYGAVEGDTLYVGLDTSGSRLYQAKDRAEMETFLPALVAAFKTLKLAKLVVAQFPIFAFEFAEFDASNIDDLASWELHGEGGDDITELFKFVKQRHTLWDPAPKLFVISDGIHDADLGPLCAGVKTTYITMNHWFHGKPRGFNGGFVVL